MKRLDDGLLYGAEDDNSYCRFVYDYLCGGGGVAEVNLAPPKYEH